MANPVAPGDNICNLLSKRNVFRVILLRPTAQESAENDAVVLQAEDGSYKLEIPFKEALVYGNHLIFEFFVRHRSKRYSCYVSSNPTKVLFDRLVVPPAELKS